MSQRASVTVRYTGRVQGVGFRASVHAIARRYPVMGWVCNLPDGRVELYAEGDQSLLSAFLEAVATETPGHIDAYDRTWGEPLGHFTGFSIR